MAAPNPNNRQSPSGPVNQPTAISAIGTTSAGGDIAANSVALISLSVEGAATGDQLFTDVPSGIPAGLVVGAARVTGANTAVVQIANITGVPVNPGAPNFLCTIFKAP